jgi:RNA polymerase sigma-70 factor (ECF subfamily)
MIDKTSFKALFEEYFDSIRLYIFFKIAEKEVSDDMAQDVFMVVWEKRETIKLQNVKSLLYKIAAGLVIDYYRKSDVRADFTKWVRVNDIGSAISPQEQAEYEETMQFYENALNCMPEGQREVFMMSREEQLSYKEISQRLDISVKAVEKRMSGALKVLNEKMLAL